jgi:hypothetical protein
MSERMEKFISGEFCAKCGNLQPCNCEKNNKFKKSNMTKSPKTNSGGERIEEGIAELTEADILEMEKSEKKAVPPPLPESIKRKESRKELVEKISSQLLELDSIISSETKNEKEQIENVKDRLRSVMADLHQLYKKANPLENNNAETYKQVNEKMDAVLTLKSRADEITSQAFSEIFYEFSDFIDNAFVLNYMKYLAENKQWKSTEAIAQSLYGRSMEEVEKIKAKNRVAVVEKLEELAQKPYITLEQIEELHAINNHGIVPKNFSRIRRNPGEDVVFGARLGLLPEDVIPALQTVTNRANDLFDKRALGISKKHYEVAAAKIHNDILDIHPFLDRNGSTALLVLELMMMREGYKPPKEREKNYYKILRKMLNNNLVAIGAVGYEQYLIKYKPGYFASERILSDKEKKSCYEKIIGLLTEARARRKEEKRQIKLKEKTERLAA